MVIKCFLAVAAFFFSVSTATTKFCNGQPYDPAQYTCYNGFLCPVVSGERTLKCGSACYLPEAYSCKNGQLQQHPPRKGNFMLMAKNSIAAINNKYVNAYNSRLVIGHKTRAYCPIEDCSDYTNTTIAYVYGGDKVRFYVAMPDGEEVYIAKTGALEFEHPFQDLPAGADASGFQAFEKGYFKNTKSIGWVACPSADNPSVYNVFASYTDSVFVATCTSLNIVTVDAPPSKFGAFYYI